MKKLITLCLLTISSFSILMNASQQKTKQQQREQIILKYNYAANVAGTILGLSERTPLQDLQHFKKCYQENTIMPLKSTAWSIYSFLSFCNDIKNVCFIHNQAIEKPLTFSSVAWTSMLATYFIATWYFKTPVAKTLQKKLNITGFIIHPELPTIVFKQLEKWLKPILIRSFAYHSIRSIGYVHTKLI